MSSFDAGASPGAGCCVNATEATKRKTARERQNCFMALLLKRLPDYLDRITLKVRIGSNQRKFFFDALRDQDEVERVAVVKFQALNPQHVLQGDRQDLNPVRSQPRSHERSGWTRKRT